MHLSLEDIFPSESPPSENSSVEAQASAHRAYLSEIRPERPQWRRNDELNHYLLVHRRTKPLPHWHSLTLGLARYLVAVLSRRPWPDHVAKRIVAFLVLGQQ